MIQEVHFVKSRDVLVGQFEDTSTFKLRTDKGYVWLQRACFWILQRIGAFQLNDTTKIKRVTIDTRKFIARVFSQSHELVAAFDRKPDTLLIGAEDFEELMHECDINQYFSFNTSYHHGREIVGLKVEVIPWMRGMLVMPKKEAA